MCVALAGLAASAGGMSAASAGAIGLAAVSDIGTAFSVVGSMNAAEAQRNAYDYQAQVARNNAITAEQNAKLAQEQGAQDEQNQRLKAAAFYSDQRAQLAANGIDLGTGSAADLLATTKFMGEHDALTIRDNAARKAWAYRTQSQDFSTDASFKSAAGSNINPMMAGATSLLTSASTVASRWYKP